jgi:hypothetical protein
MPLVKNIYVIEKKLTAYYNPDRVVINTTTTPITINRIELYFDNRDAQEISNITDFLKMNRTNLIIEYDNNTYTSGVDLSYYASLSHNNRHELYCYVSAIKTHDTWDDLEEYLKGIMGDDCPCKSTAVDKSKYPHSCPMCSKPAYIGGMNNVDCSNKDCCFGKKC